MKERVKAAVIFGCFSGCVGLFLGTFFPFSLSYAVFFCVVLACLAVAHRRSTAVLLLILSVSFLFSFLYAASLSKAPLPNPSAVSEGVLIRDVDARLDKTFVVIRVPSEESQNQKTAARISIPATFSCSVGSTVRFSKPVYLTHPQAFLTKGGTFFRYDGYLQARNIQFTGFVSETNEVVCEENDTINLTTILFGVKHRFLDSLRSLMHEPYASFGAGIVLGEKGLLGNDLKDAFNTTSLTHILVLSGYNIMIIVIALFALLSLVNLYARLVIVALTILAFVFITGADPSTVRAAAMGILGLVAIAGKRKLDTGVAIALTAFCMGLYNPPLLAYDPGFHLSFIATIGLVLFTGRFERFFRFLPNAAGIRSICATSIAAQIAVLPYLLYLTGTLSLIGVIANILVLPFVPLLMLLVFLAGAFGLVGAGALPALFASFGIKAVIDLVEFLANIPYASIMILGISDTIVFLLYTAVLFVLCVRLYISRSHLSPSVSHTPSMP